MMTTEQVLHLVIGILAFVSSGLVVYAFRMILALNDRQTVSEEKSRNHTEEIDRRLLDMKAEIDRRFLERRDDRIHEQLMIDMQLKNNTEKYEKEFMYINTQFNEIKASMIALHKRLDHFRAVNKEPA